MACKMDMKRFLITGATGYIGGLLVRDLVRRSAARELVMPVRSIEKARGLYADLIEDRGLQVRFFEDSVEDPSITELDDPLDAIIHCASVTQSVEMVTHPVETADGIVLGTKNILELARKKNIRSMVCLSSMEVYGRVAEIGRPRREDELGAIDLTFARSCYPLGKRMAEHYCHIYQQEFGVPVKVARLAQVFGRGVRLDDNRVYMQFARAARNGRDIVLKTSGRSMGNYCGPEDAVRAIFIILNRGQSGEVYNVVNESNTMRIREMADLVAGQIAGGRIRTRMEAEEHGNSCYAPDTELRLSSEKLRGLGWKPTEGMLQMYEDVMRALMCEQQG